MLPPEQSRVLFVEPDQLDEVFDSEVSERLDAVISSSSGEGRLVGLAQLVRNSPYGQP